MNQPPQTHAHATLPALHVINWIVLISSALLLASGLALIVSVPDRVFLHLLGLVQEVTGLSGAFFGIRALIQLRASIGQ